MINALLSQRSARDRKLPKFYMANSGSETSYILRAAYLRPIEPTIFDPLGWPDGLVKDCSGEAQGRLRQSEENCGWALEQLRVV
jgi:hypothetical protein